MPEELIGQVGDFFARPVVAGVSLTGGLKKGDRVHIQGHTTDLEFVVESMQIDNANVDAAAAGDDVGIRVPDRCRHGDKVFKMT